MDSSIILLAQAFDLFLLDILAILLINNLFISQPVRYMYHAVSSNISGRMCACTGFDPCSGHAYFSELISQKLLRIIVSLASSYHE